MSGLEPYSASIGKVMVTQKDLYAVEFSPSSPPSLGSADTISSALPAQVGESEVGKTFAGGTIVSVVPKGTRIRVVSAEKQFNTEAEFAGINETTGATLDLSFAQDHVLPPGAFKADILRSE